jgi:hypothetical protein
MVLGEWLVSLSVMFVHGAGKTQEPRDRCTKMLVTEFLITVKGRRGEMGGGKKEKLANP